HREREVFAIADRWTASLEQAREFGEVASGCLRWVWASYELLHSKGGDQRSVRRRRRYALSWEYRRVISVRLWVFREIDKNRRWGDGRCRGRVGRSRRWLGHCWRRMRGRTGSVAPTGQLQQDCGEQRHHHHRSDKS